MEGAVVLCAVLLRRQLFCFLQTLDGLSGPFQNYESKIKRVQIGFQAITQGPLANEL